MSIENTILSIIRRDLRIMLFSKRSVFLFVFFTACNNVEDTKYLNVTENIARNDSIVYSITENIEENGDDDLFRFTTLEYFQVKDGKMFPIQQINDNDFNSYFSSNIGDTILFSLDLSEQSLNEEDTFLIIKGFDIINGDIHGKNQVMEGMFLLNNEKIGNFKLRNTKNTQTVDFGKNSLSIFVKRKYVFSFIVLSTYNNDLKYSISDIEFIGINKYN